MEPFLTSMMLTYDSSMPSSPATRLALNVASAAASNDAMSPDILISVLRVFDGCSGTSGGVEGSSTLFSGGVEGSVTLFSGVDGSVVLVSGGFYGSVVFPSGVD